jgi:diguanylate cyclase (GGDEF)-like protein
MFSSETILIVDDRKENLDIMVDILDDFDVIPVTSGQKALETIAQEKISLVLLDIVMPEMDGYEVCLKLKSDPATESIPIIFVTAKTDEESIAQAYSAGASDYVSKPLKRSEVIARVKTQLKLKHTIENLEFLASRDSMTGAYNRRKFFELAHPMFASAKDHFYLAMMDIDHFKKVNDTYGHDAGDMVIKYVAKTIVSFLPKHAIFARIGGEEFVVLLSGGTQEAAKDNFETIRKAVASLPIDYNGHQIEVTISTGVVLKNDTIHSVDDLIKQSDLALYDAKNGGRNKVIWR